MNFPLKYVKTEKVVTLQKDIIREVVASINSKKLTEIIKSVIALIQIPALPQVIVN